LENATDRTLDVASLREICRSLAHRAAVVGGSLVSLLALYHHTRISTAVWRGGLTYLAVHVVARYGFAALTRSIEMDAARQAARRNAENTQG